MPASNTPWSLTWITCSGERLSPWQKFSLTSEQEATDQLESFSFIISRLQSEESLNPGPSFIFRMPVIGRCLGGHWKRRSISYSSPSTIYTSDAARPLVIQDHKQLLELSPSSVENGPCLFLSSRQFRHTYGLCVKNLGNTCYDHRRIRRERTHQWMAPFDMLSADSIY